MNPFFFGSSEERLFGVHHPPRGRDARETAVLLCYPLGQEYMRAHRTFRQLGMLLSRRGFHALRFDWFGTGDSAGSAEAGSVERWLGDAALAIEELKDTAGVERVSLVGLRAGAALAALATRGREDVGDLVLWDPVVEGALYLEQLRKAQAAHGGVDPGALDELPPGRATGILGFPMTGEQCRQLAAVDLTRVALPRLRRVFIAVAEERDEYARLAARFDAEAEAAELRCVPTPGSWAEVDDFGSALIPQQIVQAIVGFLDAEPRR